MGEVYRAKDTKLGRDVALKILPASFTNDPERVARFRREAQVLYEMLTGKRAFEGEDVSDTLAAVLRGEPIGTRCPRQSGRPFGYSCNGASRRTALGRGEREPRCG